MYLQEWLQWPSPLKQPKNSEPPELHQATGSLPQELLQNPQ